VNPISRQRRGVCTEEAQVALLPNYTLTFSIGGTASIVPTDDGKVYGIVMKCCSQKDWNILEDFGSGYDCIEVDVLPVVQKDSDLPQCTEGEGEQLHQKPIRARTFVIPKGKRDQSGPGKLPQERHLKVIASGMRAYGVEEDYINNHVMGVKFIPSRKPEGYLKFPPKDPTVELPTISLSAWNKKCQRRLNKVDKKNSNLILFRIGEHAIQIRHDPQHAFFIWLKDRLQGPQDSTWVIVQTLFDPDLPMIATPQQVTPLHQAWAENELMDKFLQTGIQAQTIFRVQQQSTLLPPPPSTTKQNCINDGPPKQPHRRRSFSKGLNNGILRQYSSSSAQTDSDTSTIGTSNISTNQQASHSSLSSNHELKSTIVQATTHS
jgi:hypothetical protein